MAFRAAHIRAYSLEFLAALVAYKIMHISALLEFHSKRIAYATHITSLFFILHASNDPTLLHISSSSSPGILFINRSFIISRPKEVNILLISSVASRLQPYEPNDSPTFPERSRPARPSRNFLTAGIIAWL